MNGKEGHLLDEVTLFPPHRPRAFSTCNNVQRNVAYCQVLFTQRSEYAWKEKERP